MKWHLVVFTAACLCVTVHVANAGMAHQYPFNDGTASDSIGGADGTLFGSANIASGRLATLGGGAGDSYVDLPNGIGTAAASGGIAGALSYEVWAQAAVNGNWASLASLGGADGQEDTNAGDAKSYIQLIPQNGANQTIRATTRWQDGGDEGFVDYSAPLSTGPEDQHLVVVVDQSLGLPGTIDLYVDGAHVGQAPVAANLDIQTMVDNNNWLGRSQWGDDSFNGSYDEFRIYDTALDADEVAASYAAGPTIPEPLSLVIFALGGFVLLAGVRRLRNG